MLNDKLSYTAEDLARLDEKELWKTLHHVNWNRMDAETRLAVYQEFENRQAKLDGRKPVRIRADKELEPDICGEHWPEFEGSETIFINPRYVETRKNKLFENSDTSISNAAGGLEVVMHEGRHAFQHHVVQNNLDVVSEVQRMEWASSMGECGGWYFSEGLEYVIQGIEMDARRFARRQLEKVTDYFKSIGHEDPNFTNALAHSLSDEKEYILAIRENVTLAQLDVLEWLVLTIFRETHPDEDLGKLGIFYHARLILMYPNITDPQEMLDLIDKYLDDKLNNLDAKLDKLDKDGLDKIKGNKLSGTQSRIKG